MEIQYGKDWFVIIFLSTISYSTNFKFCVINLYLLFNYVWSNNHYQTVTLVA